MLDCHQCILLTETYLALNAAEALSANDAFDFITKMHNSKTWDVVTWRWVEEIVEQCQGRDDMKRWAPTHWETELMTRCEDACMASVMPAFKELEKVAATELESSVKLDVMSMDIDKVRALINLDLPGDQHRLCQVLSALPGLEMKQREAGH